MVALVARGLSFAHRCDAPLFERVSFRLDAGFHGLVGESGAGKSTLLDLLAGRLSPDEGAVRVEPAGARIAVGPQAVESLDDAVLRFARSEGSAKSMGELALDPASLGRWPSLSPGERKRWQIAALLADEPDVLLLDEPTNHLDEEGRVRLVSALRGFAGVAVVVSHDRALLDALTTSTLRLVSRAVTHHAGSYSVARTDWQRRERELARERETRKREAAVAAARLHDTRRAHASADRARGAATRMKDKNDSDARGALAKGRAAAAEARVGRLVTVRRAEAERATAALAALPTPSSQRMVDLSVGFTPAPMPRVLSLDVDALSRGERVLLRDVHVALPRDGRVRLRGPNGAGKTTLLEALLARRQPDDRIAYLPQELTERERRRALDDVRALPSEQKGAVLSLVAALGTSPARLLASELPSPGEAKKVLLARALAARAWALVLDEPTNHLDLPTVERLEAALCDYPGALLIVSHDDAFARACTTSTWLLDSGRLRLE